jgi:hypothetical protein
VGSSIRGRHRVYALPTRLARFCVLLCWYDTVGRAPSLCSPLDSLWASQVHLLGWRDALRGTDFFGISSLVSYSSSSALPLGSQFAYLLLKPDVPDDSDETSNHNEHRKIPECVVAYSCTCSRNDEDSCQFVLDCFTCQLWNLSASPERVYRMEAKCYAPARRPMQ